jgi:murein DD-endopeptidase MepM/ murein hydrolase activator NlpD
MPALIRSPLPDGIPLHRTPHGAFGARRPSDASLPETHRHQAVDLQAPPGTSVLACAAGTVVPCDPGIGKNVVKLRLDGITVRDRVLHAVYCDLGDVRVEVGETVSSGTEIATVWHEGFVHFAIRIGEFGDFIDPAEVGLVYE